MNKLELTSINPKELQLEQIQQIYQLEQDMWARENGLGEFVTCDPCDKVFSKEDIYGEQESKILLETVHHIMNILGKDQIYCPDCGGDTQLVYGEEYIDEIQSRYQKQESYLVLALDEKKDIRGFMDGYIADFDTIFHNEFSGYYPGNQNLVFNSVYRELKDKKQTSLLAFSGMGLHAKYANFYSMYGLLKNFFISLHDIHVNPVGITELREKTLPYAIYNSIGVTRVHLPGLGTANKHVDNTSHIFIKENIIPDYSEVFSQSARQFLSRYHRQIHNILID